MIRDYDSTARRTARTTGRRTGRRTVSSSFLFSYSLIVVILSNTLTTINGFAPTTTKCASINYNAAGLSPQRTTKGKTPTSLYLNTDQDEELRMTTLESRRSQIRSTLKSAENTMNYQIDNGFFDDLDENGKPKKSDSAKTAFTLTAVVVAIGAVVLRIGGRAALVSAIGLDFATDNIELKENLETVLTYSDNMDPLTKVGAFFLAWTIVKVSCFDAAGVVLALSSGVIFGGVIQGALLSASAATFGSTIGFSASKYFDTPIRRKALEILDEYPALRGIEKVVAEDGFKAILTLRLAPILPLPLGLYNYIYGVTNVPILDFVAGIFLGSLKPYLLDSYLGYFGKTIMDGSINDGTSMQDVILLTVLAVSILLGVFASQLASETWDSVLEEIETDKKSRIESGEYEMEDGITREFFGVGFPDFLINTQISWSQANDRMEELVLSEIDAKVWNYTVIDKENDMYKLKEGSIPYGVLDPSKDINSPEILGRGTVDYVGQLVESLVMTFVLYDTFGKFSDPLFNETENKKDKMNEIQGRKQLLGGDSAPAINIGDEATIIIKDGNNNNGNMEASASTIATAEAALVAAAMMGIDNAEEKEVGVDNLLKRIDDLSLKTKKRVELLDQRLKEYE